MGETTCLMQPFSYTAGISNDAKEGNPIHGLGQSVSFGRFMSESLAWEKWSTFSHNRYVEEAEKFSRPGSVAQKKAFFEAHYKNMAARKAAALLEQANAAASNVSEVGNEAKGHENTTQVSEIANTDDKITADKEEVQVQVKSNAGSCIVPDSSGNDVLQAGGGKSESSKVEEVDMVTQNQAMVESCVQVEESLTANGVVDSKEGAKETELSAKNQMEKPLLKDFISNNPDSVPRTVSKKKPVVSSSKPQFHGKASRVPSTPAKLAALLQAKRENEVTPVNVKPDIDARDKKKPTPKSTHRSMNFTPVKEFNRITSSIIRKIDNSRLGSYSRAPKDCPTPLKSPPMVSFATPQHPLATPQAEIRRAKTPLHPSASGSKTVRPKWNFLPTDCSKFMSGGRNKTQSPKVCKPFSLRTEERAARRKEASSIIFFYAPLQKLEEKFNANQTNIVQQQATLKEKAELELKKLRKTLCFKARPLPKFYKEREAATQIEKVPLTHSQSPESGEAPAPCTSQSISPHHPPRNSIKNTDSKHVKGKNCHNQRSLASRLKSENISPNVQRESMQDSSLHAKFALPVK
ncbi:hypothetical protein Tsubulata_045754 [Turnera subulata]|uniref:TPX2 C-terminal domain-containing protein n=1 Tax=Turnera subulata TaxID=218843 RepID=A0A9Q0F0X7_9ROSI|nr:hypothetical protein Tsubulata_045754 [Turnera subulata]